MKIINLAESPLAKELNVQAFSYEPKSVIKEVARMLTREELEDFYAGALYWAECMENWVHHVNSCSEIYKLYKNTDYEKVVQLVADELIGGVPNWMVEGSMDKKNSLYRTLVEEIGEEEYNRRIDRNYEIQQKQYREGKIEGRVA